MKNAAGEAMYVVSLFIASYDGNLNAWEWLGQQGNEIVPLFYIMKLFLFIGYIVIEYDTYKRGN